MIAIIDYDAGNIFSVLKAVEYVGEKAYLTRDIKDLKNADRIIFPGVGAFGDCMNQIKQYNLDSVIKEVVDMGIPFLGVCLGMQMIFESSEENPGVDGLGLLEGKIKKIPHGEYSKIPQIGWNSLKYPKESRLFKGILEGSFVYFVHSYYLESKDRSIVAATTDYNVLIDAAVEHNNIYGCQFHPEKSGEVGLKIIKNFMEIN